MRKLPIILLAMAIAGMSLVFASGLLAQTPTSTPTPTPTADLKPWSAQKNERITWDDFKAPVPSPVPTCEPGKECDAQIAWKHRSIPEWVRVKSKELDGTWECTVHIDKVSSTTYMDRSKSWVKEDKESNELLNHEKGHLDLAEKFRREKLQPQLDDGDPEKKDDLVCHDYTATGATEVEACNNAATNAVKEVADEKKKQHDKAQEEYDKQNKHSSDKDKQKKQKEEINEELKLEDKDKDSIPDVDDNCPEDPNFSQLDENHDGIGDYCQQDTYFDSVADVEEVRFGSDPLDATGTPEDLGWTPLTCSDGQDNDKDGFSDAADLGCLDHDFDSVSDATDNCPTTPNPEQENCDTDGFGDACDDDDDNDGIADASDNCPVDHNWDQKDQDLDGIGNACDHDLDGDGWTQFCVEGFCFLSFDNCPFTYNADQADSDGDGIGDACDFPVGGIAEPPDASDSSDRNYIPLAGIAAVALVALSAGGWYARRRLS